MDSYQSILAKISTLQQKASAIREAEKKHAVAELRKLIEFYDVQPSELFSNAKPAAGAKPGKAKAKTSVKRVLQPKYQDPASGKTWNGHGKRPHWIVGDKENFLIAAPSEVKDGPAKPKGKAAKSEAGWKSRIAKLAEVAKTTKKTKRAAVKKGRPKKTASPKTDIAVEVTESGPANPPPSED
jgi:DNA-binding protein H-NS